MKLEILAITHRLNYGKLNKYGYTPNMYLIFKKSINYIGLNKDFMRISVYKKFTKKIL